MDKEKILKTLIFTTLIPLILSLLTLFFSPAQRENYKYVSSNIYELEYIFHFDSSLMELIYEKYENRMNRMKFYEPIIHSFELIFCISNLIILLLLKKRKIFLIPSIYFNLIFSIIAFLILLFYCYANTIVYYKIFDDLNFYKRFYNDELPIFLNESFNTRKILIMMFILNGTPSPHFFSPNLKPPHFTERFIFCTFPFSAISRITRCKPVESTLVLIGKTSPSSSAITA